MNEQIIEAQIRKVLTSTTDPKARKIFIAKAKKEYHDKRNVIDKILKDYE